MPEALPFPQPVPFPLSEPRERRAPEARPRPRLRRIAVLGLLVGLFAAPVAAASVYLFLLAGDRYRSEAAFSVRSQESAAPGPGLLGAIAGLGGGSATDAEILYDVLRSRSMADRIDRRLDLRAIFGRVPGDLVFALAADATAEDLARHWRRAVRVTLDRQAGILSVTADAFTPEEAQAITAALLDESVRIVNDLSAQARADAVRFAAADLARAEQVLRETRARLAAFRRAHRIVDPSADAAGQMGVVSTLEQDLAQALIERDMLAAYADPGDHRVVQADRRIAAIRSRIEAERGALGAAAGDEALPEILSGYEALLTDLEFAQAAYTQALGTVSAAEAEARRQTRYLATHIAPTRPETAEYPQRWTSLGLVVVFAALASALASVTVYSLGDGRGAG
ncbi:MAG: hypothetical protein N2422_01475 [Rhodobacteraceae bacterium]|nr:hypothetical protein [Paracoccaceae bacterium]